MRMKFFMLAAIVAGSLAVGCDSGDDSLTFKNISLDTTYYEFITGLKERGFRVFCPSDTDPYWVDIQYLTSDCSIAVYDPDGYLVASADNFPTSADEACSFTVPTSGYYRIIISEWDGWDGSIDITVTPPSGIRPALPQKSGDLNKAENTGKIKDKTPRWQRLDLD